MLEVGAQVGPYNIVRRLGAGGMGEVYLGRHRHIGRDAAIKVLLPELSKNEDVVARFFTEARATAAIRHPGIVEILDCDVLPSGRAYIVMEFLQGENLAERLARVGSFAEEMQTAASIVVQVAGALAAAHAKGIVHRDLKPDNVFLCGDTSPGLPPVVKILDFGIAKLVADDGQGKNKTRTGSLLGTPTYMSPEQCRGAGSIDHRTDIYALGCMAFEMVAGRPPFVRPGSGEVLVAHLVEPPPQLSSLVRNVPPEIEAVVGAMLEKDPAARPQTMVEIAARVEAVFGGRLTPIVADPGSGAVRVPTPPLGGPTARPIAPAAPNPVASNPVIAGGTRVLPAVVSSRTTLSDTASEANEVGPAPPSRPRWLIPAVIGGVAVVLAVGLGLALSGPSKPPPVAAAPHQAPPPEPVAPPPPPPPPVHKPPPEVTIEVASDPSGAEVWLPGDDSARGHTPLKIAVRRGEPPVRITLKSAGYNDAAVTLDPAQEDSGPVNVALEKVKTERKRTEPTQPRKHVVKPAEGPYKAMGD